jgi:hypothetical protein
LPDLLRTIVLSNAFMDIRDTQPAAAAVKTASAPSADSAAK